MGEFLRNNAFIVGALTGSLAAYLLGLFVSYLRREKRWLGYSTSSRNIVQRGHSKLAIKYDGRDISRLDSHTIQIRNIGNRPLTALPVKIECLEGGEIVEHEIKAPDGAQFAAAQDGVHQLVVTVDLLNPGEAFTAGITVADARLDKIKVIARGEHLQVREIGERATTDELLEILIPTVPFIGFLALDLYRLSRRNRK